MAIVLPLASDKLGDKGHSLMHRVYAVDDSAPSESVVVNDIGNVFVNNTFTALGTANVGGNLNVTSIITGGSIQNTPIGSSTRNTGAFTTLTSNGSTTFTAGTPSTSTSTGTLVVSGGLGVSGAIYGSSLNASTLNASTLNMNNVGNVINFGTTSGSVGYIKHQAEGILRIGSDVSVEFYETDTDVLAVDINTNLKTVTASGGFIGNASTATKLATARSIGLTGDVTGSANFDGSGNISITATVADDSHNHVISNVDGLQTALDAKQATLVSGTNIKTVGGTSLLGSGDVAVSSFPAGTLMLFQQTTAPTGWTKQTSHDNKALRVVSGTAGSGGSVSFTSAFASYTPSGSVSVSLSGGGVSASSLTVAQLASHRHTAAKYSGSGVSLAWQSVPSSSADRYTGYTGSNSTHTHGYTRPSGSGSFTGTARSFAVQYVDLIIASKD